MVISIQNLHRRRSTYEKITAAHFRHRMALYTEVPNRWCQDKYISFECVLILTKTGTSCIIVLHVGYNICASHKKQHFVEKGEQYGRCFICRFVSIKLN